MRLSLLDDLYVHIVLSIKFSTSIYIIPLTTLAVSTEHWRLVFRVVVSLLTQSAKNLFLDMRLLFLDDLYVHIVLSIKFNP